MFLELARPKELEGIDTHAATSSAEQSQAKEPARV